ncbi:MAG: cytochrome d ubiquinol oxidase subunit II [Actinomycetia bacterium]|nr:cytochrome d ubiquinol oxidase subunit II [Actinomycetes bacterium]
MAQTATFLQTLWFILIGVLLVGYFVLDGFDLGVGILYPFLGKTEKEKAMMRVSVGPVWDGNEVWLLTAGGALFAAFGPAYATSFSGFYLAIMLVLFGLIIRAISLEFRHHDRAWAKLHDACFFLGSLVPALLFGVAVGNVVRGLPLNPAGDYTGGFFALLNPFALFIGVLGLTQFILQGLTWLGYKAPTDSGVYQRVKKLQPVFALVVIVVTAIACLMALLWVKPQTVGGFPAVLRWVSLVLILVGSTASLALSKQGRDLAAFIASSVNCVALVIVFATTIYPNLIPASSGPSITIASAGGSDTALLAMTIIAAIGVPLVLFYHFLSYRAFRGRVTTDDMDY